LNPDRLLLLLVEIVLPACSSFGRAASGGALEKMDVRSQKKCACPISEQGRICTWDSDIRERNTLNTHKTLSDLSTNRKKKLGVFDLKKNGKCPISNKTSKKN